MTEGARPDPAVRAELVASPPEPSTPRRHDPLTAQLLLGACRAAVGSPAGAVDELHRVVLRTLAGSGPSQIHAALERLEAAAARHRVTGPVRRGLALLDLQGRDRPVGTAPGDTAIAAVADGVSDLDRRLEALEHTTARRQLQVRAALQRVATTLGDEVPWLTFKGPVLAAAGWAGLGPRSSLDIDVLVAPDRFRTALGLLEGSGHTVTEANWRMLRRAPAGQLHLTTPFGIGLDLHWHLVNAPDLRRGFDIDVPGFLERRVAQQVGDVVVPTLDPTDTVLHLALHTVESGAHRLSWFVDLHTTARRPQVDWLTLEERAEAQGLGLVTAAALQRTVGLFGTPVDLEMVRRLDGGSRRLAQLRRWDRRRPVPATARVGMLDPAYLLARTLAATDLESDRRLAARIAKGVTPAGAWRALVRLRSDDGYAVPTAQQLDHIAGTLRDREAFMDHVERAAGMPSGAS